jgi:hypothetical protein
MHDSGGRLRYGRPCIGLCQGAAPPGDAAHAAQADARVPQPRRRRQGGAQAPAVHVRHARRRAAPRAAGRSLQQRLSSRRGASGCAAHSNSNAHAAAVRSWVRAFAMSVCCIVVHITHHHARHKAVGGAGSAMHFESDAAVMQAKLAPPPPPSSSQAADLLRAVRPPSAASVDPFATMAQDGELHTHSQEHVHIQ